jgi:formylmethanofuran dehydrogenase subunit C
MKRFLLILAFLSLPAFIWFFWQYSQTPETISSTLQSFAKAGEETKKDLSRIPSLPVTEEEDSFIMQDDTQIGISITYANQQENNQLSPEESDKDLLSLSFPKDATKPLEIKLDKERIITIQDLKNQQGFTFKKMTNDVVIPAEPALEQDRGAGIQDSWYQKLFKTLDPRVKPEDNNHTYLTSTNQRKTLIHTFQKDHATNEKKLKSWTLYTKGNGIEEEAYQFTNAKIKINDDGNAEVFYFGDKEIQNQQAKADVEPSLLERAQRVISEDMGADILNSNKNPDFLIPKPFFYDKNGDIHETDWKYDEANNTLSLQISVKDDLYPLALDPTLAFTAPAQSNTGWVIGGETTSSSFGTALASGDFNADGKIDLVVGAPGYSSSTGRAYIFYNDGSIPTTAATADVIITGETTSNNFGISITSGDFNADSKTDLAVGAYAYSSSTGRAYLFYNDGSLPTTAATADVIITGETTNNYFGYSLTSGDFNADGKTDLAVGSYGYSSSTGRAYIFYNDGSIPTTAATADVIITGETTSNYFGTSLASGDFNADGKTDLVVGAFGYSTSTGRAYLFYNDGSLSTTAATADVIITGEITGDYFGASLASGDFNADGRIDLAVGARNYSSSTGRVYLFYNGSIITENASGADVIITGETTSNLFGYFLSVGDFNTDGKIDLVVSAWEYSYSNRYVGRVYLFYNDGSTPTTAATADVIITGEESPAFYYYRFGSSLVSGDFNSDGKTDLAVGAYSTASRGRAYIFTSQNGQVNTNVNLTGETTSDRFGYTMTSGDFNADGKTDLAIGAYGYSSSIGRVYIFYNDGSIPTTAATADVIITGAGYDEFGINVTTGDLNADGKTDIVAGADWYSGGAGTGRAYIFYADGTNNFGTVACTGSAPTACSAGNADVIITGEAGSQFGNPLATGDFNADGKIDLVVGAWVYSTNVGRAYLFYNDGSIPTTAATADVIITGESNSYFGVSFVSGDFNADGKTDLVVGAYNYSSQTGRAYLFYNDGSIPTTAATADVIITGETTSNYFGYSLTSGDFNADGKTDLAVGAYYYSSVTGRVYLFYNDGSIPTTAATADVIITGETTSNYFGISLVSGDFNADGKTDLAVGASNYLTNTGCVYLFYNDGSIPTTAATADVMIAGETTNNYFGISLVSGDFNADGKTDLAVGARGYSTNTGRVYLYETRDNFAWQLQAQSSLSGGLRTNPSFSGQELKVTGEVGTGQFGNAMIAGDFNADGKTDLAVGASAYSTNTGRVYIFYNDGHLAAAATSADVIITGETTSNYLGYAMTAGDFNADSKIDLAVGAYGYSSNVGRVYIFYNDGSISVTAVAADIIITGETGSYLGDALISGDFNADGETDLVAGASSYTTFTGRAYLFYNDGSIPTTAATADAIITGETTNNYLGYSFASGDFNADGKTDLVVGAWSYSSNTGRVYIFYSGSIITENASGADILITGETTNNYFGQALTSGDFNVDGKVDLAIGAYRYSSYTGRAYIFYNGSIITENASGADVFITGETTGHYFGASFTAGDFNADGRIDLAIGARGYSSDTGRAYLFYNDGSIPTTAATADVIITGETTSNYFSYFLTSGDFNADGKTDLVVGAYGYSSNRGRVYMYTFNDGAIAGETTSNNFGYSLTSGDFNADGKTDLAVGANGYSTSTGRAYLFYNDGSLPTAATGADVIITGEASSQFGVSMTAGDFNADGKTDLIVGATQYSSNTGRAYLFYNDGSIPTTAATADVIITGAANDSFGGAFAAGDFNFDGKTDVAVLGGGLAKVFLFYNDGSIPVTSATADVIITGFGIPAALASGDFNADGRVDLAIGDVWQSSGDFTGKTYLFYNDGSIPTTAGTADLTITGETTSNYFGISIASGDFNADSKTDLAVGARAYSSSTGRTYIFYNDGSISTTAATADVIITGEATSSYFGFSLTSGDFNADGRVDLAVGAPVYSSNAGRTYIFYNDGSIPTTAASADVIIPGSTGGQSYFGWSLTSGDFDADGKVDLGVGSYLYSGGNATGRVYILTTEAKADEALPQWQSIGSTNIIGNFEVR